jgi:Right handed beta helix region
MIKFYPLVRIMLIACFTLALASIAQAQATRTWVSGVGDDLNPCSRTAPCKTWAGAISKTAANGEIDALDPGGYGSLTVTKNITVDGTQGAGFGSTINSLVNGFNINDSATATPNTIVVTLRNLSILAPANGTNGINFTAGKTLNVEDCDIIGNTAASTNGAGIRVSLTVSGSSVNVKNTNIFRNRVGILATTTTGNVTLNVNNCNIEHNTSDGIFLDNNAFATVRNSNLSFNGGAGLSLDNSAANSATLLGTEANHNLIGIFVGTGTTVRLGHSSIVQNGTNFSNGGTIVSFCNNETDSATIPGTVSTNCLK